MTQANTPALRAAAIAVARSPADGRPAAGDSPAKVNMAVGDAGVHGLVDLTQAFPCEGATASQGVHMTARGDRAHEMDWRLRGGVHNHGHTVFDQIVLRSFLGEQCACRRQGQAHASAQDAWPSLGAMLAAMAPIARPGWRQARIAELT